MKRSPLQRGTSQLARTPLARIGRKKRSKASARAEVIKRVRRRDRICQFWFCVADALAVWPHGLLLPCLDVLDVHEIVPRSVWPDGDLEVDNCVLLCRRHHEWIDSHREIAEMIGLYRRTKP
jgi:5-methylcytosine-specific restriction endonuclease McrA